MTGTGLASDGLPPDPVVTQNSTGSRTWQPPTTTPNTVTWTTTVTASGTMSITMPAGGSSGSGQPTALLNSYHVSAIPLTTALRVDQDLQVLPVAATTRFSATISNDSGFTVDSVRISVDGTGTAATVNPNNPNNYYIDWPQTGGNPKEHTVTATATIHDAIGSVTLDSKSASGNGRPADDIIADVRPLSAQFNNNIPLAQNADTPIPAPEILWGPSNPIPYNADPAAYIQGKSVNQTLTLGDSAGKALTGQATTGYSYKLQANPYTINPATKAADPTLTLYDNTTGTPFTPTSCGGSVTVAATTPLDSWVAKYGTSAALSLYVEFTKIPTPMWRQIGSYSISNVLYAVVDTPKAPMSPPWVVVLDKACIWAARTASATDATTALTKGFYNSASYNPKLTGYTTIDTSSGTPVRDFQVNSFLASGMTGPCYDFAAFMVCLSNSLGAVNLSMQTQDNTFTTKPVTAANSQAVGGSSYQFLNHAWSTGGSNVYDGALKFGGTTYIAGISGPDVNTAYYNGLVSVPPSGGWADGLSPAYSVKATN